MKQHLGLKIAGAIVAIILFFAGVFSATFFLTSFAYAYLRLQPAPFVVQTTNSVLGLVLGGLILSGISAVTRSRHGDFERGFLGPIIAALGQIAQGDFDVRLDDCYRDNQIVGDLVKSVNHVALELGRVEQMRREFISMSPTRSNPRSPRSGGLPRCCATTS